MHSATKYLGGHSDVVGGAIVAREAGPLAERLRFLQATSGAVPSPFDCWLLLRGAATLHLRVRAQSDNALKLGPPSRGPSAGRAGVLPRPRIPSPARPGRSARCVVTAPMLSFTLRGGEAAALAYCGQRETFHPRHQSRRCGEPDRTPGLRGGAREPHPAQPVAHLRRRGTPRRPHRRPGPSPGLNIPDISIREPSCSIASSPFLTAPSSPYPPWPHAAAQPAAGVTLEQIMANRTGSVTRRKPLLGLRQQERLYKGSATAAPCMTCTRWTWPAAAP